MRKGDYVSAKFKPIYGKVVAALNVPGDFMMVSVMWAEGPRIPVMIYSCGLRKITEPVIIKLCDAIFRVGNGKTEIQSVGEKLDEIDEGFMTGEFTRELVIQKMGSLVTLHNLLSIDYDFLRKLTGRNNEFPKYILDSNDSFIRYMAEDCEVQASVWPKGFRDSEESTYRYFRFALGIVWQNACNIVANAIHKRFR